MTYKGLTFLLLLHTLTVSNAFTASSNSNTRGCSTRTSTTGSSISSRSNNMVKTKFDTDLQQSQDDKRIIPTSLKVEVRNGVAATTVAGGVNGQSAHMDVVPLDPLTYENQLIKQWDESDDLPSGFDWEMEKLRRHFAGLRMQEDGSWVKRPGIFDFLASTATVTINERGEVDTATSSKSTQKSAKAQPRPVTSKTIAKLFTYNILSSLGLGPVLGLSAVPDAVIQKYEGSFLSFITGVLGGDLQTLAGGPLFLLLAKYYQDYGPIFNLSFGPKSFLVVSDPVMAKHILKSSPDAYCKGMLAEILEPIMGKGLIPADPETWKVSTCIFELYKIHNKYLI